METLPSDEDSLFGMNTWLEYQRTMSANVLYSTLGCGLIDMGR